MYCLGRAQDRAQSELSRKRFGYQSLCKDTAVTGCKVFWALLVTGSPWFFNSPVFLRSLSRLRTGEQHQRIAAPLYHSRQVSYMTVGRHRGIYIYSNYLRGQSRLHRKGPRGSRLFTKSYVLPQQEQSVEKDETTEDSSSTAERETEGLRGRMSERLAQMTEESIEQGGNVAKRTIQEAGFSEELKRRLEARIEESKFKSENAAAFAQITMPVPIYAFVS